MHTTAIEAMRLYCVYAGTFASIGERKNKRMEKGILDENLTFKDGNKIQPKLLNWVSIIILWGGIGYCYVNGIITEIQVIAGIFLLIISTIVTFFKYEVGVKITLGIIALGVLSLVKYFPISYSIGFGIGNFGLAFEMLIFLIGIIHYFTNKEILSKFLNGLINREVSEEELQAEERSRINGYKNRFSKKNMDELEVIANNESLLPEAIKAAKELIEKRKTEANKA